MAIIFDLDGTLMNTIADMGHSMNRVLAAYNLPVHDLSAYQKFVGNGMKKLVERALGSQHPEFEHILEAFLAEYAMHLTDASRPYPGVVGALKRLNALGIPIAICTNKKQVYTDTIIEAFFGDIEFVAVIGDQFDGLHKPNPHYALQIAQKMNMAPEAVYFVGDSDVDMQTAQHAQMIAVGVSWGFRSVEELRDHGAATILNTIDDIFTFFKSA